jgi:hypothetical protein
MDDFDRLGLEFGRECLITSFQALVEAVGSKTAIKIWRPYCDLSGRAIALNLKEWTKDDDVNLRLAKMAVITAFPYGGECKSLRLVDGETVFEREGCGFLGSLPEFCECYCCITWSAIAKQIDPEIEVELSPCTGMNNPRCITRNYHKTRTLLSEFSNRDFDIESIAGDISEEEIRLRSHLFTNGVWMMLSHAIVNSLGPEAMIGSLSSSMRRNGLSFGLRITQYLGIEGRDLGSVQNALAVFGRSVLQKQIPLSIGPEELKVEVKECWWCGHDYSTSEHCQLVECINDGICKAINPEYEFRYDLMKTKGADKCVWTVRKNSGPLLLEAEGPSASTDSDLISILKMRLAKGEISVEQYEKIVRILK